MKDAKIIPFPERPRQDDPAESGGLWSTLVESWASLVPGKKITAIALGVAALVGTNLPKPAIETVKPLDSVCVTDVDMHGDAKAVAGTQAARLEAAVKKSGKFGNDAINFIEEAGVTSLEAKAVPDADKMMHIGETCLVLNGVKIDVVSGDRINQLGLTVDGKPARG